ncbi:MAG: acyltransferase family protein [Acidimicrobiia bacterium]
MLTDADRPADLGLEHQPALDGLRGVAVAGVLLFHAGHLDGGFLGVDAFFVLSGYLITSLLLREHAVRGTIGLARFWGRRARRLLPALACLLVMVAVYCVVIAQPSELDTIRGDALATIVYVANWRQIATGQDYFALFRAPSVLQHTWSLSIEEQFYLVWPLLLLGITAAAGATRAARRVVVVALALAAVSYVLAGAFAGTNPSRAYYGTDTRVGAILLGAAFAAWTQWRGEAANPRLRMAIEVAGLTGIAVLAVAWTRADGTATGLYRGGLLACGVAVVAVIAAAVHPRRLAVARVLSVRPLVGLGLISYGAYLYHWPVYLTLAHVASGTALLVLRLVTTVVVATASYLLLERPIRTQSVRVPWRVVAPLTAVTVVAIVLAATAGAEGPPGSAAVGPRLDAAIRRADAAGPDAIRLLLVGDSVGWHLGTGFPAAVGGHPLVVANVSLLACVFPPDAAAITYHRSAVTRTNPPGCDTGWARAARRFRPDDVLFALWAPGDASFEYGPRPERPCDATYVARTRRALRDAVRSFERRGARVALMTYPYTQADLGDPTAARAVDCMNATRGAVARSTGARLIDVAHHVCPTRTTCTTTVAGGPLRPDGVHFDGAGARVAATWVAGQLAR